jgi:hypothetical protein
MAWKARTVLYNIVLGVFDVDKNIMQKHHIGIFRQRTAIILSGG